MTITTTLNRIRAEKPCREGWAQLLQHLDKFWADDEPLRYSTILVSNGLADALWCCRAEPQLNSKWRLYAVWCARQVQDMLADYRSVAAIDTAERYAHGEATREELIAAREAAWKATQDKQPSPELSAMWAAVGSTTPSGARAASWTAEAACDARSDLMDALTARFLEVVR